MHHDTHHEGYSRTLRDYKEDERWIRELGWTDEQLDQVPVHEQATAGEDYLNLTSFGATGMGPGMFPEGRGGTSSAGFRNVRNLFVYRDDVPEHLYRPLENLVKRGGPSAYETGVAGERGEAEDFPPRS